MKFLHLQAAHMKVSGHSTYEIALKTQKCTQQLKLNPIGQLDVQYSPVV